jgi:hypothetical protein
VLHIEDLLEWQERSRALCIPGSPSDSNRRDRGSDHHHDELQWLRSQPCRQG